MDMEVCSDLLEELEDEGREDRDDVDEEEEEEHEVQPATRRDHRQATGHFPRGGSDPLHSGLGLFGLTVVPWILEPRKWKIVGSFSAHVVVSFLLLLFLLLVSHCTAPSSHPVENSEWFSTQKSQTTAASDDDENDCDD